MSRAMHSMVAVALGLAGLLTAHRTEAQTLPTGFSLEAVVPQPLTESPIGFTFLPDGRVLMLEQTSALIRVSTPGSGVAVDVHTVPDVETTGFEQGLQGIAVDPQWPARPYLYLYYNHAGSVNYVTMYTVTGDLTNPASTSLTLTSPFHLLTDIPDVRAWHNGGTLRFGPDGMLYLSLGDDGTACDAQDRTVLSGSILRMDVSTMPGAGTGPPPKADLTPADNPFSGPDANEKLVYAWGVRNPFRFTIDELTGDLFVADVGFNGFEEIDHLKAATPGGNYGWPQFEGFAPFGDFGTCGAGNAFTSPIYAYPHDKLSKSVTGGPLFHPVASSSLSLPGPYDGSYFFTDFYEGWIRRLVPAGGGWELAAAVPGQPSPENWAEGIGAIVDFQTGPDGALYLIRLSGPQRGLYRIRYTPAVDAPISALAGAAATVSASPNPTTAAAGLTIRYALAPGSVASLRVLDVTGRSVRTLAGAGGLAGAGDVRWDGRRSTGEVVAAGIYFYRLETAAGEAVTGKVSLIR